MYTRSSFGSRLEAAPMPACYGRRMATVQLRRYQITPGEMDAFVEWWPTLLPAREKYGFNVLFAFVDEATNQFVWAVSHDGDFDAVEKVYLDSPERAAVFAGIPRRVDETFISKVNVIHQGWPAG
jgi:hypothetical protein